SFLLTFLSYSSLSLSRPLIACGKRFAARTPSTSFFSNSSGPLPHLHSFPTRRSSDLPDRAGRARRGRADVPHAPLARQRRRHVRSEEHTSELQSLRHLVCRLLLEKKNLVIRCQGLDDRALGVLCLIRCLACGVWLLSA